MSRVRWPWLCKFRDGVRNAFSLEGPHGGLSEADFELLDKLAKGIVARRMATPALLFLRSVRPLNFVGSQALVFLRPFLTSLFRQADYDRITTILERRESLGALVEAIERESVQRGPSAAGRPGSRTGVAMPQEVLPDASARW